MISVILYGRNDSYGYNLHKRGAISLNCLAALLSDPDDEILFVDCNTPDDIPTFIEAIYDTLTPEAKARLRVLRVRPELHRKLLGGYTHLMVVEPPPRNIALRRSNPKNYWVLNTNTDIILLPRPGFRDLNDVVRGLADGLYTLPRFELPEPLWESFPRSDPEAILRMCRELGPRLHLDEVTLSHRESRYDQVGDFQLSPRQALWDIHGFDERMVHGWHCDSNICKRMYLLYGRTESLAGRLKGYHCDHTRVQTGMHQFDMKLDNNMHEFVFSVDDPYARHQAETWGLPDEPIEELNFGDDPPARYRAAVKRAIGAPQQAEYRADALSLRNFLPVNADHVLPYLAGDLSVYRRSARFAYAGNHARLLELVAKAVIEMGFENAVEYAPSLLTSGAAAPEIARPIEAASLPDAMLENYDLVIFDFSLDGEGCNDSRVERVTDWPRELRHSLGAVGRLLAECANRAGTRRGPDFLAINANHPTFRNFAGQFLLLTEAPYAMHVRKGRLRSGDERLYRSHAWKHTEDDMRSFFGYDIEDGRAPAVAVDEPLDFSSAGCPARFQDGHWGVTDYTGSWTEGWRAVLIFQPPNAAEDVVACVRVTEAFIGVEGDPIQVDVRLDGTQVARWSFAKRYEPVDVEAVIPMALVVGKVVCRLEFHVENPQSTARAARAQGERVIGDDPRLLGIKVQRVVFRGRAEVERSKKETADGPAPSRLPEYARHVARMLAEKYLP